jgi:branched-chain amino acid transport system ATP-binding protein
MDDKPKKPSPEDQQPLFTPALELRDVVAGYGQLTILNGLSFAAKRGEITTLIGANGAGKSTVFKTVFGLVKPRSGSVFADGEDITGLAPKLLMTKGLVYVPQGRNLFPMLTVEQNLELGGITLRDKVLLRERMDKVYWRFPRIRERSTSQASALSGGEQKQLEVGRALLLEPRLLFIDEPSIGLAPKVVREVFDLLRGLADSGVAIVMVEQNAKSALAISNQAIVLEQGRVAIADDAQKVLNDPRIGRLLLGGHVELA